MNVYEILLYLAVILGDVWYNYLHRRRKLNVTSLEISGGLKVELTFWLNEKGGWMVEVTFLFFCKFAFFVEYRTYRWFPLLLIEKIRIYSWRVWDSS